MKSFNHDNFVNYNLNWNGYLRIRQLAKHLGRKEGELRNSLIEKGILHKVGKQYLLTTPAVLAEIGTIERVNKYGYTTMFNLYDANRVKRYLNGDLSLGV